MRSFRHFLVVVTAVALLMILAASSALGAETKAKSLYLVKNCATFATASTCVITSSSLKILRGSTLHYLEPGNLTLAGTPMLLTTANTRGIRKGTANGFCQLNFGTGVGHCSFTSGTGSLAGFHMDTTVLHIDSGPNWSLTGTYYFSHGSGDDNDDNNGRD
jgi:hypothetical protein